MEMTAVPARARDIATPTELSSPGPSGAFWVRGLEALCAELRCGLDGLGAVDAARRLERYGPNSDAGTRAGGALQAVLRRLLEPLALILIAAGLVSVVTGDVVGGVIIVAILGLSIGLDTVQEGHATRAAEALRHTVALKAEVRRDGSFVTVPVEQVVPGDILRMRAGDIVPADALVIDGDAFTVAEAALTGEPYPVEKRAGPVTSPEPAEASNAVFAAPSCGRARQPPSSSRPAPPRCSARRPRFWPRRGHPRPSSATSTPSGSWSPG